MDLFLYIAESLYVVGIGVRNGTTIIIVEQISWFSVIMKIMKNCVIWVSLFLKSHSIFLLKMIVKLSTFWILQNSSFYYIYYIGHA